MTRGEALSRVQRLFVEERDLEVVADAHLVGSGAMDSLTFARLPAQLEQELGLRGDVAAIDLEAFASVSRIARFVAGSADGRA